MDFILMASTSLARLQMLVLWAVQMLVDDRPNW